MTKQFVTKIRGSEIGMRPVLPLAQPVNLGYVGTIDQDGCFQHRGTVTSILRIRGMGGEVPPQQSPIQVTVTSGSSVQTSFQASAVTTKGLAQFGDLSGKASISFGRENGFFLAVQGLKIRQLAQPQHLFGPILKAYRRGAWDKDWVFIQRIGVAQRLTVILAKEAATVVLLKASARVAPSAVVDFAAGFKFEGSTKAVTQITGGHNLAAFYDAYQVKDRWFAGPEMAPAKVHAYRPGRGVRSRVNVQSDARRRLELMEIDDLPSALYRRV